MFHVAASSAVGIGVYWFFNSWTAAATSFMAGVFIDLDHMLDYFVSHGFNLNVKNFYNVCEEKNLKKFFLLLHSIELQIILWIVIISMNLGPAWKGIAIGFTQHLLFDQLVNCRGGNNKLRYFLIYRIKNNFDQRVL